MYFIATIILYHLLKVNIGFRVQAVLKYMASGSLCVISGFLPLDVEGLHFTVVSIILRSREV